MSKQGVESMKKSLSLEQNIEEVLARASNPRARSARAKVNHRTPKRSTQEERSEETRAKLLDAAVRVIAKRGYLRFTTQEAAKLAGVTRGAPLHHFRTTEAFLRAALDRIFAIDLRGTERVIANLSIEDDVLAALVADARDYFFGVHFFVAFDVLISASKSGRMRQEVRELAARYRSPVEALWRGVFVARGIPADVAEDVVWLTLSVIRGLAIRTTFKYDHGRIERTIQLELELVRRMLVERVGHTAWLGDSQSPAGAL